MLGFPPRAGRSEARKSLEILLYSLVDRPQNRAKSMDEECSISLLPGINRLENRKRQRSPPRSSERPPDEGPRKRRPKRGKYISKACNLCQKRKTKCDGGYPCKGCIAKGLECVKYDANTRTERRSQLSSEQPKNDIAMALSKIQRQLNEILAHQQSINVESESGDAGTFYDTSHSLKRPRRNRNSKSQSSPYSSTEVFSGEPSITHVYHEMESHLEKLGMARSSLMSPPPSEPLTPIDDRDEAISNMDPILSILHSHGIVPEKTQWDELLSTFIDEVYILYPFLHLPALRNTYEEICDQLLGISTQANYNDMRHRLDVSQVLFCLAIGRCSESTRKDTENGHHSSGWSLFRASMKILGEPLEIFDDLSLAPKAIQSMLLAVIYLYRIDASNKTEKFLALIVSHSQFIGLHRKEVTDGMPIFEAEMFRRAWWCTYIIDRRLALDTGRPFLIQDVNTDVSLPLELVDSWLSNHIKTRRTGKELETEIEKEISRKITTPVRHIIDMVSFSRVVGKVWEAQYGAMGRNSHPTSLTTEYLELLISSMAQVNSPTELFGSTEIFHGQFAWMEWWQIKQMMLMRIRWLFLRLLIRKSSLRASHPLETDDNTSEMVCMQLCRSIILEFHRIPNKYPKHTFPFIHYVATSAMIALGLVVKQQGLRTLDLSFLPLAARTLRQFCTQTWVSGQIIRAISRIDQITAFVLGGYDCISSPSGSLQSHLDSRTAFSGSSSAFTSNENAEHLSLGQTFHLYSSSKPAPVSKVRNDDHIDQTSGNIEQVDSNSGYCLPMDTTVSSSSTMEHLVMTDFDFEKGSDSGNWPCLSQFFGVGLPNQIYYPFAGLTEECSIPSQSLHTASDRASPVLSTATGLTIPDSEQAEMIRPYTSTGNDTDWLQSLFGTRSTPI